MTTRGAAISCQHRKLAIVIVFTSLTTAGTATSCLIVHIPVIYEGNPSIFVPAATAHHP
jgi:hypothetical protein